MSNNLKKRLEFNNKGVQNAAIEKIKSQIIKERRNEKEEGHSESQCKKIPELELLWDKCHVESSQVNHACCTALTSLVLNSDLDLDEVVKGFLNLYPTAKNVFGIIGAIMDLLVIQTKAIVKRSKQTLYKSPYQIRLRPHPFITCLMSRPDTWPFILHQLQHIFSLSDKNIQPYIIPMLEPFLKYLFLEPVQSVEYAGLRRATYSSLLQHCSQTQDESFCKAIINFFLECIPNLQICLPQHTAEFTTFIGQFSNILILIEHGEKRPLCQQLANYVTSFLFHARLQRFDISNMLLTLKKLREGIQHPPSTIVLIGWFILESSSLKELSLLFEFVEESLSQSDKLQISKPVALFLVYPLVQVNASPPPSLPTDGDQLSRIQKKVTCCLRLIQQRYEDINDTKTVKFDKTLLCRSGISLCPSYIDVKTTTKLLMHLHFNSHLVADWLAVIQSKLDGMKSIPDLVMMIVGSLLMRQDENQIDECLKTLISIARKDPTKAPSVLTLLLYLLGVQHQPSITMRVMSSIPETATHRYCISPVLKFIQLLGATRNVVPVSIRLMTALWKLQDRCFPHLQKMLTFDNLEDRRSLFLFEYDEELLAKAATIRDICITRPFQHGADFVHFLSNILNDFTLDLHAIPASFALEGLTALCEAEVVDIRSTWRLLSHKLQIDRRMLVQINICKLLSLVPSLVVNTEEYEEFQGDVVELLWLLSTNYKPAVAGAAFKALARFDPEEFTLFDLPDKVTFSEREKLNAKLMENKENEEEEEEEDDDVDVPGSCYMKLLLHIHEDVLPDYGCFLNSMIQREVKELPRRIYHPTELRQPSNEKAINNAVATISGVLKNKYDRNKQPGLKAGLAGGLLCSFESVPSVGREGKVERRHLASSGRNYQQMLTTLVNELPVHLSDWFQSLHLPLIWRNFMERAFFAVLEGRKAELEIQESHGHRDGEEDDLATAQSIAWLWTRDKITDILKSCARGNPSAQANSVLALTSLAFASTKHANSLGQDAQQNQADAPEHMGQNYWLETVAETVLCLLDSNYQPKKRVFTWCQRSSERRSQSTTSPTVKSCAALALSILIPVLTTNYSEIIFKMVECLCVVLLRQQDAEDVPSVLLHIHISLGLFLKILHEERFTDVIDQEGKLTIMKAVDKLEGLSLMEDNKHSTGAYLGLMLALVGMCHDGSTQTRVHLSSVFSKLKAKLDNSENAMDKFDQGFLMCLSYVTASLFTANLISKDVVVDVITRMHQLLTHHSTSSMFSHSFGSMLHSLVRADHPQVLHIYNQISTKWFDILQDKSAGTPDRLAAVSGLTTLVAGPGAHVYGISENTVSSDMNAKMTNLVKQLILLMNDNSDMTLQNQAAWLLGYTYMATMTTSSMASASTTYSQLPESSILRSTIDFLIEAGKVGPEGLLPARLEVALKALWDGSGSVLPPLNWAGVLSPIKRLDFGVAVHVLCLQLALRESVSSPSASLFLTAWTSSALFNSLKPQEKNLLYKSLPVLIKTMPLGKLKFFLATNVIEPFTKFGPSTITTCESVLIGLKDALAIPDPPQSVMHLLYQAVEKIYDLTPKDIKNYQLRQSILLSECICQLPGEMIDIITSPVADNNLIRSTFIRSHIVSEGKQSLTWLNPCIDVAMHSDPTEKQLLLWYILSALSRSASKNNEHVNPMSNMTWLLELMGHIHNVANQLDGTKAQQHSMPVHFLIEVFTAAVTVWSSTLNTTNLSIPLEQCSADPASSNQAYGSGLMEVFLCQELVDQLPLSLSNLLNLTPWSQITDKIIDWLITIHNDSKNILTAKFRDIIKECVYSLRHTAPFKKFAVWSKAMSSLD